jgi:GAF domain-containing protein
MTRKQPEPAPRISASIKALEEGMVHLRAGDLGHRVRLAPEDPVARVGRQFNQTAAELEKRFVALQQREAEQSRELTEALDRQTATAEILRTISQAQADIQPVFEAIADSAMRLFGAWSAGVYRYEGGLIRLAAARGGLPGSSEALMEQLQAPRQPSGESPRDQAVMTRAVQHVVDVETDPACGPRFREHARVRGFRSTVAVPMLRGEDVVGVIAVTRERVGGFAPAEIAVLQTFADQAVIAVQNARLLSELQAKNANLTEALEQQTATGEILRVISGSPTDVQPVFDVIASSALRLCDGVASFVFRYDGALVHLAAFDSAEGLDLQPLLHTFPAPPERTLAGRAVTTARLLYIADIEHDPDAPPGLVEFARANGFRSIFAAPMLRDGRAIGAIGVIHRAADGFTPKQGALLETFAAQAVIAIENVRLFNETMEALEQQTATSAVLRIILSSPTDIRPIFDAIVESALKLCDGVYSAVYRVEGDMVHLVAHNHKSSESLHQLGRTWPRPLLSPQSVMCRAIRERTVVHVSDMGSDPTVPASSRERARVLDVGSILGVPMLREGAPIGAIRVSRREPGPFSDKQISLLKTFADQAVIAIENVRLFTELQEKNRALTEAHARVTEALEQQTATSEILRVISSSPTDVQPVFEAIVDHARRLCEATFSVVILARGTQLAVAAIRGVDEAGIAALHGAYPRAIARDTTTGRAILDHAVVHIPDTQRDPTYTHPLRDRWGLRSILTVPFFRDDRPFGAVSVWRPEPKPFTDKQVALLQTFADQAVIAIENVRLFTELRARNRELTEALEQQTATGRLLQVISSSPTDVQPVFDAIARSAVSLCEGVFGSVFRFDDELITLGAQFDTFEEGARAAWRALFPMRPDRGTVFGKAILARAVVHVEDIGEDRRFPEIQRVYRHRSVLIVPMLREGAAVGAIGVFRQEVKPFSDRQVSLLQTFADQAVIAIENVRLFKELQEKNRALTEAHAQVTEALEQQTATADILRVIASSPTDLQPVMKAVVENAARVCGATDSGIWRLEGEHLRLVARRGSLRWSRAIGDTVPVSRGSVGGRAVCDRRTIHVEDVRAAEAEFPKTVSRMRPAGSDIRTMLATPLVREGTPLGVIFIHRGPDVHPFSAKQIALLETFATQAVIAIENVRLFNELRARTAELTRSVEQLTALGEVSRAVSSTLEVETVLTTVVARAHQLAGADACTIYEYDEDTEQFHLRATHNLDPEFAEAIRAMPLRKGEGVMGRATELHQPVQVPDISEPGAYQSSLRDVLIGAGYRAALSVPLLREDHIIGSLSLTRKTPGEFSPEVVELLKTFATQSALAIQNARLFLEIEEKSRQLEAASRHKSEFLANMSHELRTPLNAILGFSEVLTERMFGDLNPKQEEYLRDIHTSGQHLLSLINDILDLSKVEAGRLELELASFNLPMAVENAMTLVRERATRHGITLDQAIDDRVGDIVADERKVKQILLNLLSNAVKFTPAGGRIGVTATATAEAITISVSDTGIGIAPEDQATIFEEFRQVGRDDARKQEGTGLGLTLAKKFVELHGGQIGVRSQVGQGSTFTFTLPVRPEDRSSSDQGGGAIPLS